MPFFLFLAAGLALLLGFSAPGSAGGRAPLVVQPGTNGRLLVATRLTTDDVGRLLLANGFDATTSLVSRDAATATNTLNVDFTYHGRAPFDVAQLSSLQVVGFEIRSG